MPYKAGRNSWMKKGEEFKASRLNLKLKPIIGLVAISQESGLE